MSKAEDAYLGLPAERGANRRAALDAAVRAMDAQLRAATASNPSIGAATGNPLILSQVRLFAGEFMYMLEHGFPIARPADATDPGRYPGLDTNQEQQ